jgi:hypothetical protein
MTRRLKISLSRYLVFALLAVNGLALNDCCSAERIPTVRGTSLTNVPVTLPESLKGHVGVLVIGFSRGSRDGVSGWGRRLEADYQSSPAVVYYELPVLASAPGMIRGLIVRSMKSSIPEGAQSRFVPVLDHEAEWRAVAHYEKPDDPYVLVVDGQGEVVWRTEGQATDAAYAALKQQVEVLKVKSTK